MEAFLKSLPGSIFGTGGVELNRWNHKVYSMNMLNSGLICTRDFNSFDSKHFKALSQIHEVPRKHFLKRSFMTKCKPSPSNKSAAVMSICYSTALSSPSCLPSLKSYSVTKKYFLPSLLYHQESVSVLHSVLCPKSIEKPLFSKIYREKCSQSPESLKSSAPSSKYLKRPKYLLKRKLLPLQFCKQYSSCPASYSSCPHSLSQEITKSIQETPKRLPKSQMNKTRKTSVYRGPCYPIFLRRVHWRGFHSSLFPLAKSDSNKPSDCTKLNKICKSTKVKKTDECGQHYKEKSDVCRQKKIKCDKPQESKQKVRQKPKTVKKIADSACKKTCLPIGKCELPRTVPPPKMEYAKVTCPPPKFAKPKPCPSLLEYFQKDNKSHTETKQINVRKKQICTPPPLPKPPYAPIVLCPCPPPPKVHPGPCPCYETKAIAKQPSIQPCPLKKKYPCPTGVHYCLSQKKPCNLKRETGCDRRKKKEAPAS